MANFSAEVTDIVKGYIAQYLQVSYISVILIKSTRLHSDRTS